MDLITVIIAITIIVLVPSKRVVQKIKVTLDNVVFLRRLLPNQQSPLFIVSSH